MRKLTWRCLGCDVLHVNDDEPLRCRCGAEWDPLRAPVVEVDAYALTIGLDPDAVRAEGRHLFAGGAKGGAR